MLYFVITCNLFSQFFNNKIDEIQLINALSTDAETKAQKEQEQKASNNREDGGGRQASAEE